MKTTENTRYKNCMKYATICIISVFLLFSVVSVTFAEKGKKPDINIPKVEYRGGIYYLVLDGKTPYSRGYQHGKALEFPINMALRNFKEWLRTNAGIKDSEQVIQEFVQTTGHISSVKKHVPDLVKEMQGIADGAGIDFNELFVYQSFDELLMFLMHSGALDIANGHCTTTAVYGRPGKSNFVTHNNDIPTYHEGVSTVLHIKYPDSDLEILQSTFAGQIAQNGVNNRGVGVGMNTIADLQTTQTGIPVSFNVRKILQCKDRHEAIAYLKKIEAGTAMNYMICDRKKAVTVETWERNAKVIDKFDGQFAAHTNHSLQENAPVMFKMDASTGGGSYGFTHQRLDLAVKTLTEQAAKITFDGIRKLKSTRPILVNPGKPSGRTLQCMIVEIPAEGSPILYQTPDSPNWFGHVKFGF
jgi:predicted choloylglycine hydrolase